MQERLTNPREVERPFSQLLKLRLGQNLIIDQTIGVALQRVGLSNSHTKILFVCDRQIPILRETATDQRVTKPLPPGIGRLVLSFNVEKQEAVFIGQNWPYKITHRETRPQPNRPFVEVLLQSKTPAAIEYLNNHINLADYLQSQKQQPLAN